MLCKPPYKSIHLEKRTGGIIMFRFYMDHPWTRRIIAAIADAGEVDECEVTNFIYGCNPWGEKYAFPDFEGLRYITRENLEYVAGIFSDLDIDTVG